MAITWFRTRKPAQPPRHARLSQPKGGTPDLLLTGPFPAVTPGSVLAAGDFERPLSALATVHEGRDAAGPDEQTGSYIPDFAEEGALARSYAPEPTAPPPAAARLLAMVGGTYHSAAPLGEIPYFAGLRDGEDEQKTAAVCIGMGAMGRILLETSRADVLDALESAARAARDALVYSGFRAPAVQPDPDAAGHRKVLERELDAIDADEAEGAVRGPGLPGDSIETARAVLQAAAGNPGFISAALRRENAEGVLNFLVARADLARASGREDEPAAVKAAEDLVDVVSDLCGDEVACAIANGIAPADEAATDAGTAPEAAAADSLEPAAVPGDRTADGQDGPVAA